MHLHLHNNNNKNVQNPIESDKLTGDDQTTLGGTQTRLAGQPMLGAALVALVAILGTHFADMQLAGGQHQVLAVCTKNVRLVWFMIFECTFCIHFYIYVTWPAIYVAVRECECVCVTFKEHAVNVYVCVY